MPHPTEHRSAARPLGAEEAQDLAETLKALASPTRLRLLAELLDGPKTVDQLATAVALSPSATSHALRLLRNLRLVRVARSGRHAHYTLHDHHVPELLAAIRHHHEHLHPPAPVVLPAREEAAR